MLCIEQFEIILQNSTVLIMWKDFNVLLCVVLKRY